MSKRDSLIILGLAVALTYANLLGPQRLLTQLFPGGTFVGTAIASRVVAKVTTGPASRPKPAVETGAKATVKATEPAPIPVRAVQPPIAKPAL